MDNESVVNIHDSVLVHDDSAANSPAPMPTSASLASSWAVAIPVEDTSSSSNVPMWQQEKQASICCGCCCDYRMAVICLASIRFVILVITSSFFIVDTQEWSPELFLSIVYTSMSIFSWVGAMKYSICLIVIDLLWCVGKYYNN